MKKIFAQSDTLISISRNHKEENISQYIRKESVGGALDFKKSLEKDEHAFFLYGSFAYNKKDFSIFLWGKKVKNLGLASSKEAVKLWQEIYNHQLTAPEEKALVRGFETKSDN
ncbi:hypothetical protein [Hymenobacter negativus]|uniref:Uncharacterized protein n=1 Tax=Hymenobacter negativus TaxID=2795026 RepID=A0ABS3QIE3_9BACT|nr:hypothetical protein [Hymenobacter negativus]MBO2011009.1 hypothetical protein [Hymenobacter negativus]